MSGTNRSVNSLVWFVNAYWFPHSLFDPSFLDTKCVVIQLYHPYRDYGYVAYIQKDRSHNGAYVVKSPWNYSWADIIIVVPVVRLHSR